ncbi:MAG: ribonuclease E/G [Fusicatenibacter sp.]
MSKKIVTANMPIEGVLYRIRILFEKERPIEIEAQKQEEPSILGNIYTGIVEKVASGIRAAFVRIDKNLTCYLPLDAGCPPPHTGDELLVQISREAQKTKLPTATTELSLSGTYLVVCSGKQKVSFSSRLKEEEKKRLEKMAGSFFPSASAQQKDPFCCGIIFRTSAREASMEDLREEYQQLQQKLECIRNYGQLRTQGTCVYQAGAEVPEMVQRYGMELSEYLTDVKEEFDSCQTYFRKNAFEHCRATLFQDKLIPLYKQQNFDRILNAARSERVALPSGGFLVIQPTEAFVSIDVNSGKQLNGKYGKRFFYDVNCEAAKEIAAQLRLRGLSGLILIDFISMEDKLQEEQLLAELQKYVREDPIQTRVIDMTVMHIAEVTRQKKKRSLAEQIGGTKDAAWRE